MTMEQQYSQIKVNDEHLEEDPVEAEFAGATLAIASDTEGLASSREDLNSNPDEGDSIVRTPSTTRSEERQAQPPRNVGCESPVDSTKDFFAKRAGAFENAVEACRPVMLKNIDGDLQGAWLLTEIDHWDTEKERMVLLTDHSLISIKYDFITLKVADYRRLLLKEFDKLVVGEFTYPEASIVPRVDKLVNFVKSFVWGRFQKQPEPNGNTAQTPNALCVGLASKRRTGRGVRAMWNKGKVPQAMDSWNPWSKNIPWITYASHPLKTQTGQDVRHCDIEHFIKAVVQALNVEHEAKSVNEERCIIEERPIIIENYLGLASFFHNVNNLGFFKSRGRVSF